jgi:hypothetical protein
VDLRQAMEGSILQVLRMRADDLRTTMADVFCKNQKRLNQ